MVVFQSITPFIVGTLCVCFGFEHRYVGQVAVFLGIVQAVTDDESVIHREANVVGLNIYLAGNDLVFVQKGTDLDRFGLAQTDQIPDEAEPAEMLALLQPLEQGFLCQGL